MPGLRGGWPQLPVRFGLLVASDYPARGDDPLTSATESLNPPTAPTVENMRERIFHFLAKTSQPFVKAIAGHNGPNQGPSIPMEEA